MEMAKDRLHTLADCGLLARIWPGERVIMGTLVCTWTRRELLRCADEVHLRVCPGAKPESLKSFARIVSLCAGKRISVFCKGKAPAKALINGISCPHEGAPATKIALHHIDMRNGFIRGPGAETLGLVCQERPVLNHLDLFDCSMQPADVQVLAVGLGECKALRHVSLTLNNVGDIGAALINCKVLLHLGLRRTAIKSPGAEKLGDLFKLNPNLEHIDLGGNDIAPEGIAKLAVGLGECCRLKQLRLDGAAIGNSAASVAAVTDMLGKLQCLERLDLFETRFRADGVSELALALPACPLRHVQLGGNAMGAEGAQRLAHVLPSTTAMEELYLDGSGIGDAGATALAAALPFCRALKRLELRRNGIRAAGAQALGTALAGCPTLEYLELCDNVVGDEGGTHLAQALAENPPGERFMHLGVRGNNILAKGQQELARAASLLVGRDFIRV